MSKYISTNPSKKLKVLKYSLLASISVGAIIVSPLEGVANSVFSKSLENILQSDQHQGNIKENDYIKVRRSRSRSAGRKSNAQCRNDRTKLLNDPAELTQNIHTNEPTKEEKKVITITYNTAPQKPAPVVTGSSAQVARKLSFEDNTNTQILFQVQPTIKAAQDKVNVDKQKSANKVRNDREKNAKLKEQNQEAQINTTKTSKEAKKQAQPVLQKAEDIKNIKSAVSQQMTKMSSHNITVQKKLQELQEIEKRVLQLKDKKELKKARNKVAKIRADIVNITKIATDAQKVAGSVEKETSRKKLNNLQEKIQEKMNDYVEQIKNNQIDIAIKNLELSVPTPPTPPSISTIPTDGSKKIPLMPYVAKTQQLSQNFVDEQGNDDVDGYLKPNPIIKINPEYLEVIAGPTQPLAQPELQNFDSDQAAGFDHNGKDKVYTQAVNGNILPNNTQNNLYYSPSAVQDREDHKKIVLNIITHGTTTDIKRDLEKSLFYLDNTQYREVLDFVQQMPEQKRNDVLIGLAPIQESKVQECAAAYTGLYNSDEESKTQILLQNSQNNLDLIYQALGQLQPLSTIYEAPSFENLVEHQPNPQTNTQIRYRHRSTPQSIKLSKSKELDNRLNYVDLEDKIEKAKDTKESIEEQYGIVLSQNPNDPRLEKLAVESLNLSVEESDLEQAKNNLEEKSQQKPVILKKLVCTVKPESKELEEKLKALIDPTTTNPVIPQIIITSSNGETLQEPIYANVNKDKKRTDNSVIPEITEQKAQLETDIENDQQLTSADSVQSISELLGSNEDLVEAEKEFEALYKSSNSPEPESTVSDEDKKLASDDETSAAILAGDEKVEDNKSSMSTAIAEASDNTLSLLPASDEPKLLRLKDNSKDESDNDSGIESELSDSETSDSEEEQVKAINTAIHEEAVKETAKSIIETPVTTNHSTKVVAMVKNSILNTRLDTTMVIKNNETAIAAGDEGEPHIQRGFWMRGMYGTNNQGRVDNINGYKGINKGGTIGFDVEIDNNVIGIAYSNVHSVFKFKNNKHNDKELINSHVVSIYGQKELPKNFVLQALVAASRNFIKDKTTYSLGNNKFKNNVKHRNDSYNAEALLNYNHLLKNNVIITPNIGLRYGKSRDGVYNETGISVQEISLTMKENNIMAGIVGTKVKIPLKDILKINNLGLTLHGAVEHNIKEKTQRVNRVVQILDNKFTQNYVIPKQPKTSYNLGTGIVGNVKNTTISLEYNHYLNKHYRSHQGSIKLKVSL